MAVLVCFRICKHLLQNGQVCDQKKWKCQLQVTPLSEVVGTGDDDEIPKTPEVALDHPYEQAPFWSHQLHH